MAMGALMGSHSLATTPRSQVAAAHSSGQSTWQRGSTSLGSVNVQPSRSEKRCVPVVKAIKIPFLKVGVAPVAKRKAELAAEPSSDRVANEVVPSDLGHRWREIGGENDWKGLLDPLNQTLREEILRYGEFTQAAYDNFEFDDHSKYCGSARFNKDKMFSKVGLNKSGYEVQRYFYATANAKKPLEFFKQPLLEQPKESWSKHSNWMGYIAVSTDEKTKQLGRRDIMIAWRGTVRNSEWAANYKPSLSPASLDKRPGLKKKGPTIEVETGFQTLYTSENPKTRYNKTSARTQVLTELKRLLDLYKDEAELSITICGHSLGSALATLNAYDIADSGVNIRGKDLKTIPITVFSFGGPRVGNEAFLDRLKDLGVKVLRIVNVNDVVPGYFEFSYTDVGTTLELDSSRSTYLDQGRATEPNCHNMEQYLHLVDGHQGKGKDFNLTSRRPLALVNKSSNFLTAEHPFPESWWQRENKGLVLMKDHKWVELKREKEDIPTADDKFS